MNNERLFRIIGDVEDDLVEEAEALLPARSTWSPRVLRWSAVAACLLLAAGLSLTRPAAPPQLLPQAQDSEPLTVRAEISPFSSPMGMRKFFNCGGYRYAFLENGAPYDLSEFSPTEYLGTLEHDILAGMETPGDNNAATLDLATTFALGGEIYKLPGYDPAYRVAVVWEGRTYLAELVGRVDNQPLDPGYFFTVSDLESHVLLVEILPHMGGEALSTVKKRESRALVRLLADSSPARLTDEDYLTLAAAQAGGRSWQLALRLDDGTSLSLYLIPDLGLVTIADSTYVLPEDFAEKWGRHFEGLVQGGIPLH